MKTLYSEIPRHCRWFYPEGEAYIDRGMGNVRPEQDQEQSRRGRDGGRDRQDNDNLQVEEQTISTGKRAPGRPKKVHRLSADSGQAAIHRYFSSNHDPPVVAGPSGARMVKSSNVEAENFIDGEGYSSDESINDFDIGKAAKRSKDDPDDELDALLDATSNHSNNVGSNNDDISDPEEIATEYSVDLNHNAGKIVMKIVKK